MNLTKLRKTLGPALVKALASVVLVLTPLSVLAPRASAVNQPDAMGAFFNAKPNSDLRIGGTPATVAVATSTTLLNLYYSGPSTAAYVSFITGGSNSGLCAVFYAPFNVPDTSIGSATCGQTGGAYDLGVSTMNTLGAFSDAINGPNVPTNGQSRYHAILTGGIRNDPTAYLPTVNEASGVNTLNSVGGFSVPVGTATIMSFDLQPDPGSNATLDYCTVNAAGTPNVYIYGVRAKYGAQRNLFGANLTDSSIVWESPALTANTSTNLPTFQAASSAVVPSFPWLTFLKAPAVLGALGAGTQSYNVVTGNAYSGHAVVRVSNYNVGPAFSATNFISCTYSETQP